MESDQAAAIVTHCLNEAGRLEIERLRSEIARSVALITGLRAALIARNGFTNEKDRKKLGITIALSLFDEDCDALAKLLPCHRGVFLRERRPRLRKGDKVRVTDGLSRHEIGTIACSESEPSEIGVRLYLVDLPTRQRKIREDFLLKL